MIVRVVLALVAVIVAAPVSAELYRFDRDGQRQTAGWVLADDITDPLFATMLGVIDAGHFGVLHQAELDSIVNANGGSKLPHEVFSVLSRQPAEGDPDSYIEITLSEPVDRPIPYSLLGYNPGSIRSSGEIHFLHFEIGARRFLVEVDDEEREVVVEGADLFVIAEGFMEMDFDGWLDRLLGSKLDDMTVRAFFTFWWEGQRYSLGMGLSNKGRGKTGAFDFVADETLFPAPQELLVVGREMRAEGLRRLAQWEERNAPAGAPSGAPTP
jgi:hypothetical protein